MRKIIATFSILFLLVISSATLASGKTPIVQAVLFFSPTCPHCHKVMTEDLPPLTEKYGEKLQIMAVDVTEQAGADLYKKAVEQFSISDDRHGVPTLVVGETVLVGSSEIPAQFPQIVQSSLSVGGGVAWPEIPGLSQYVAETAAKTVDGQSITMQDASSDLPDWIQRFLMDPAGNSMALVMLPVMLISVIAVAVLFINGHDFSKVQIPAWVLPLLSVLGIGVAFYLSFIEVTKTEAFCGPIGNCNDVQKSPYAILFGFLPVGILGLMGYAAIVTSWVAAQFGPARFRKYLHLALWGFAWFGILFSIYLTFLEPFVIGATCAWCISSALIMTLIFWVTTPNAITAFQEISPAPEEDEPGDDEDDREVNEGSEA